MPEFREARLGDVADVRWGDTNTTKASYTPNGFTAFSASGPDGFLPHYDYDRTGIVLSAIGSECGKVWLAKGRWSCIKNTIRFFSNDPQVRTEYLYWLSNRDGFFPRRGSGQPFISQGDARDCRVMIPDIKTQDAICELLGSLNDKIELNRRINETLEAMAQAIFRDWFVDFGPVRRKMAGATDPVAIMGGLMPDPAGAAKMAALFPDRLNQEELPHGWRTKSLEEIATFTKGRSYKSSELQPSKTALVTLKSFARGGGYRRDGLKPYTGTYNLEQVVCLGDIVLAQTDVTQAADIVGRPAIVSSQGEFETLIASLDVVIIRAKKPDKVPREYLYQMLRDQRFTDHALAHVTGTTVLHLAKAALPSYSVISPPDDLARAFDRVCGSFREKILSNDLENRTLAETRDYLLPRLMSGEVRVSDAALEIAA